MDSSVAALENPVDSHNNGLLSVGPHRAKGLRHLSPPEGRRGGADDTTADRNLRVPPSNHFEKRHGNLAGFHSIRVNRQWRLVFRWHSGRGEGEGVYLDDHSYR
jgi:hypothetical protein